MADELSEKAGGESPLEKVIETVPPRTDGATASNVPAGESAAELAAKHGGRPSGRGRADGLTPGSPEAAQKDRERDAERKREQRAARAKLLGKTPRSPAAIPSALPSAGESGKVVSDPADLLQPARAALVLWAGTDMEPVLQQLVEGLEEWRNYARERKLALANLDTVVIAELVKESKWSDGLKKVLCESGSRILAKLLNKSGISAENKDEVIFAGAMVALAVCELRFNARVNKLIAATHPQKKLAA